MTRRYTREELLAVVRGDTVPGLWEWIQANQPNLAELAADAFRSRRFRPYERHMLSGMARMLYLQAQERSGNFLATVPGSVNEKR